MTISWRTIQDSSMTIRLVKSGIIFRIDPLVPVTFFRLHPSWFYLLISWRFITTTYSHCTSIYLHNFLCSGCTSITTFKQALNSAREFVVFKIGKEIIIIIIIIIIITVIIIIKYTINVTNTCEKIVRGESSLL